MNEIEGEVHPVVNSFILGTLIDTNLWLLFLLILI